ncbi:sulfite exporter TauE/SafE family protein [Thiorhodococcus mannitoliphagus]|uniref:Sulfite exporter TauE/SafE family protein n=1 Tax=Thiorhodococcus mannitoliphagus TaxID=329406 RepID=A0A6P1DYV1_9GAMM|nr:sulfite exporter TauE/SafE family protein [Thiorhodococcus mannitoliphagus]NEX22201.1 sulfite exporter TauE/SafE family protein [Thiorhodococcus mannitoliphagus]
MSPAYPLAFLVGLLSALHCIGMCGGIAGAISYSLPQSVRRQPSSYVSYQLLFNLGRILSYCIAGAAFGWLGASLIQLSALGWLEQVMRLVAAAVLMGIGLYIGGWLPGFAMIERVGLPLWRRLEPARQRLLPVRSPLGALLIGLIWGWIPCGLIYSMLIGAPAQGGWFAGAIYMAAFGLGTLPVMLATGLLAGRLGLLARSRRLQALAGITLIGLALFTLYYHGYNQDQGYNQETL